MIHPKPQREIESRIQEVSREVGLLEPNDLTYGRPAAEHDFEAMEEPYSERERASKHKNHPLNAISSPKLQAL